MSRSTDTEYLMRRAAKSRDAALSASDICSKIAHAGLAAAYQRKVDAADAAAELEEAEPANRQKRGGIHRPFARMVALNPPADGTRMPSTVSGVSTTVAWQTIRNAWAA